VRELEHAIERCWSRAIPTESWQKTAVCDFGSGRGGRRRSLAIGGHHAKHPLARKLEFGRPAGLDLPKITEDLERRAMGGVAAHRRVITESGACAPYHATDAPV